MDDPNITMEEYIRLEEEKAQKHGISFDESDDEDYMNLFVNGTLFNLIKNLYVPFGIPFNPKRYCKDVDYARMLRRPRREIHKVQVFDFGGLPDLMAEGLSARMLMEHRDAQGQSMFTSRAWRRLFDIRGPLVHELILKFFCTFRFGEDVLDLDAPEALQFKLGGTKSARRILGKGDIRDYWIGISSAGDYLGTVPSYTFIMDPMLRLWLGQRPLFVGLILEIVCFREEAGAIISGGPARKDEDVGGAVEEALVAPRGGDEDEDMPQDVPPPPRT
nr:hypothetical protein [Tanacetum cinerariifolium]GEW06051.1 hypothetical protein [Tanacetum cinerariifolium]